MVCGLHFGQSLIYSPITTEYLLDAKSVVFNLGEHFENTDIWANSLKLMGCIWAGAKGLCDGDHDDDDDDNKTRSSYSEHVLGGGTVPCCIHSLV